MVDWPGGNLADGSQFLAEPKAAEIIIFMEHEPEPSAPIEFTYALAPTAEQLDSYWYERLMEIVPEGPTEGFAGDPEFRAKQKERFINGEIENPRLDLPKLNQADLDNQETLLVAFKNELLGTETVAPEQNELIRQVYRWRINEKIAEVRLMRAALNGDMHRFERYNAFINGQPSPTVFAYTVQSLKAKAGLSLTSDNEALTRAAQGLINVLPDVLVPAEDLPVLPSEENVELVRHVTKQELAQLLDVEEFEGKIDAQSIKQIFESVLHQMGLLKEVGGNWEVIIDPARTKSISVSQEEQKVKIGQDVTRAYKELVGLIVHELGTHVLRREHGERSKLALLGYGLDRYTKGDEGVAAVRQNVIEQDKIEDFAGLKYHLAISLARGLDGKKRNFREVHSILTTYHNFIKLLRGRKPAAALKNAKENAYNDCVRVFRGTDCTTPGVVFTKDLVYREGTIGIYDLISTEEGKQEMHRFSVGKYSPLDSRHLWVLDQLGINEADLDSV